MSLHCLEYGVDDSFVAEKLTTRRESHRAIYERKMRIGHYRLYDEAGVIFTRLMTERIAPEALKIYSDGLEDFEADEDKTPSSSNTPFSKRLQCQIFLKYFWDQGPWLALPMNRYTWTEHARRNLLAKARSLAGVNEATVSALYLGIAKETNTPPVSGQLSPLILGEAFCVTAREEWRTYFESDGRDFGSDIAWIKDEDLLKSVRALFPHEKDLALAEEGEEKAVKRVLHYTKPESGAMVAGKKRKRVEQHALESDKRNRELKKAKAETSVCPEALQEAIARVMRAHDKYIRKALLDALKERHRSWRMEPKEKRDSRVQLNVEEIESLRLDGLAFILAQSMHHSKMSATQKAAVLEVLCSFSILCSREYRQKHFY